MLPMAEVMTGVLTDVVDTSPVAVVMTDLEFTDTRVSLEDALRCC